MKRPQTLTQQRNWNKFQVTSIKFQARNILQKGAVTSVEKSHLVRIEHHANHLLQNWKRRSP